MFKHRDDLLREVLRADKNLAAIERRFGKRVDKLFRDVKVRVEALIRNPELFDEQDRVKTARMLSIANQMSAVLDDAGMDALVEDYRDAFPALTRDSLRYFELLGEAPNLVGIDRQMLETYIDFTEDKLRGIVDRSLVAPLQQALFDEAFGGMTRQQVVDNVLARTDSLSPAQAQLVVGDSMAQYQRTVTAEKADALDLEVYLYQGPSDEITSEQCQFMLDYDEHGLAGAFYKDEISADLHPNLRANPLIAGGHPRCRHRWTPVTLSFAKEMGFKE